MTKTANDTVAGAPGLAWRYGYGLVDGYELAAIAGQTTANTFLTEADAQAHLAARAAALGATLKVIRLTVVR